MSDTMPAPALDPFAAAAGSYGGEAADPFADAGEVAVQEGPHETVELERVARIETEFGARRRKEAERFEDATDSEYWCCLYFQNRAMKEEFLRKLSLIELGDKYLDGVDVAKVLGVTLETPVPAVPRTRTDGAWSDLAKE